MEKLTVDIVQQLVKIQPQAPAVTLYIPMHTTGSPPHITENQIRFKNLMQAALSELEAYDGAEGMRNDFKQQMEAKLQDSSFFEAQYPGLLILADSAGTRLFQLPIDTESYAAVDNQYHLAPIMSLMHDMAEFYLLSVAQHHPVLLRGDIYGLHETNIKLPETLIAGLNIDEANQKSEHSLSAGGSSLSTNSFNGRGGARNPNEDDRMRFFRMIDGILLHKADRSLPLILGGIDSETVEYKSISKYPRIMQATIAGSMTQGRPADLYTRAFDIVRTEIIEPKRQQAVDHYQNLSGANPNRTAAEKESIETAADQGRVETLLVKMTRTTSDTIRDRLQAVPRITFPDKSLSMTLNHLAQKVATMSGTVLSIDDQHMPNGRAVAATLRF